MNCLSCGNIVVEKRRKYCSADCRLKAYASDEYRNKISTSRRKFLSDNPDKHPWKNSSKFKSAPCEALKKYLTSRNIKFVEEWQPLPDRYFAIDIAFPDTKLGIEVNGNQHYDRDGSLRKYYKDRHDLITAAGWKLIELHYSSCYDESLLDLIINVGEQPDYSEYFKLREDRINAKRTLPRGEKNRIKTDEKWEPFKSVVENSNIDFGKFGWVSEVATLLNIKPQKVNGWMKRYLPDIYENKCFKRKAGVPQRSSKP